MKKGVFILAVFGIVLAVGLSFLPVSPSTEDPSKQASPTKNTTALGDSLVDDALDRMEEGSLPPMQAVLTIRDISERFPENSKAQFTLGVMSIQTGQYEKAVDRFEKVIALRKDQVEAYRLLAKAHLALGDSVAAREGLEDALLQTQDSEITSKLKAELAEI